MGAFFIPMKYHSLQHCINDLEKHGRLIRITEEVDPYLEMAAIHLRVFKNNGPAILFENIKDCQFKAVSNLFGSFEQSKFLFRNQIDNVKQLIELKNNPTQILNKPLKKMAVGISALNSLPIRGSFKKAGFKETTIDKLPFIQSWGKDGGAFITLPQVYSEDPTSTGVNNANLGMYRVQLNGNDYEINKEIGLHYQIHRGIGVHQQKAGNKPLKVSVFIGGPPSHTFAAVMPLPEGISELKFAGVLGGKRFRYTYKDGYCISLDADFVITGEIYPNQTKPEGPFGDHLGYYSLTHNFPVLRVSKVYHKPDAIWPFTVVGRPPQEDSQFGALIHEISSSALKVEIPGLHELNAVDEAGVHPLLLAIGSERYTPFQQIKQPQELLTIANRILGSGQLSLAKYLFIANKSDDESISTTDYVSFFTHVLERVDFKRDLHFQTNTTIDTLDYSGTAINQGSKVVIAAVGKKTRKLNTKVEKLKAQVVFPGVLAVELNKFIDYNSAQNEINLWINEQSSNEELKGFPLIIICDDAKFVAEEVNNFLWVTFTRSNPSHDIYGIDSFIENKHWGCKGSLIIDARIKSHHASVLELNEEIEKKVDKILAGKI